jgi:hypothetical protein
MIAASPSGPPEEQALEAIRETLCELEVREEVEALVSRHENSFTESRALVIDGVLRRSR